MGLFEFRERTKRHESPKVAEEVGVVAQGGSKQNWLQARGRMRGAWQFVRAVKPLVTKG